jgi:hypothetical protein
MMLATGSLEALQRIADRANDVLAAYAPSAVPRFGDVQTATRPLPVEDPLSVAAPPGTWFVTVDERGARTYTRAGSFNVGADGTLQTVDGARVLGTAAAGGALAPLRLPEPDRTLGRCENVHLEGDGILAYARTSIDPRTRERSDERVAVGPAWRSRAFPPAAIRNASMRPTSVRSRASFRTWARRPTAGSMDSRRACAIRATSTSTRACSACPTPTSPFPHCRPRTKRRARARR